MALSCGAKCAKGVLVTFNLIFWLSGCALVGFGIYILVEKDKQTLFQLFTVDGNYALIQYLAFALIGIGGLILIVGFFGCCGAIQENKCMIVTYFIFLFLILVCELAVGILAVIFREKVTSDMEKSVTEILKTEYGIDQPLTQAIDLTQTKFKCCGIKGAEDYLESRWKKQNMGKGDNISKSCCVLSNMDDPEAYLNPHPINETLCQSQTVDYVHKTPCLEELEKFIKEESFLFMVIGCGIAALEIFGMIFSICLCKEI